MFQRAIKRIDSCTKFTDFLPLLLAVFTCTFFIYRDFGLRMFFGYAVLCLLLMIHFARRVYHNRAIQVTPVKIAFLFLCLVLFINFLRPASRHDSDGLSLVISMLVCCAFVCLTDPGDWESKKTLDVFFVSAILMAVYVLFFVVFPDLFWTTIYNVLSKTAQEYLTYYVPKGYSITIGGCTYTNYILFFGMAVCCGYMISAPKWDKKCTVMLIAGGVFLLTLLLVGRRGELIAAIFCFTLLGFLMCSKKQRMFLLLFGSLAVALIVVLFIVFLPQLKQIRVLYRYVITIENLLNGWDITSGRTELYAIAFDAFLKHPIWGIGLDQFHTLIPLEFLAVHGADVEDVHNIYLQFLCETGIVGTVLIISPLGYLYYQVCAQFRRLKRQKKASPQQSNLAFSLCCASFLIQSFILFIGVYDPCFQRVIFWCFYGNSILLMICAMQVEKYRPNDAVSRFIYRIIDWLSPAGRWIWGKLSLLSKENTGK